eukprot:4995733-Pleurochrysis_carterae.AAC.2
MNLHETQKTDYRRGADMGFRFKGRSWLVMAQDDAHHASPSPSQESESNDMTADVTDTCGQAWDRACACVRVCVRVRACVCVRRRMYECKSVLFCARTCVCAWRRRRARNSRGRPRQPRRAREQRLAERRHPVP